MNKVQYRLTNLMTIIVLVVFLGGVFQTVLDLAPAKWFFYYYDIKPTRTVVHTGYNRLLYMSELEIKFPMDLDFNDILHCERDDWGEHSSQNTRSLSARQRRKYTTLWSFRTDFRQPNRCYMESNITATINVGPFMAKKRQTINENLSDVQPHHIFTVVAPDE